MSSPSSAKQPFLAHVEEVRFRLFVCLLALLLGLTAGYLVRDRLLLLLVSPLHQPLYYTSPGGGFNFILQLCIGFGGFVMLPVLLFHILRFVAPVLPSHSGRFIAGCLLASCLLMGLGIAFAYLVSLPAALHFLNEFSTDQVKALISTDTYVSFVLLYLAAFAILFQLPLVLLVINKVTPLPPRTLLKQLRWVVLVGFVVAAIVTPTQDPVNQSLMAAPIVLLYLLSVGLVWLINRHRHLSPWSLQPVDEVLADLSRAKLVAQRASQHDGRPGMLCLWEERRWAKLRRQVVTFEQDDTRRLVRVSKT